ncbi:thiamine kinase [uncultured Pantoea sp.]|uniref:thiamine kinase n=1 Tax=uncultured Pantoea sp. TaxID=218084 RepID=UPI0025FBC269|nr:thiamine kinase [uncultured Pantoea sp.]
MIQQVAGDSDKASIIPLAGLTGHSQKIVTPRATFIARAAPQPVIPFVERQREFRLLRKLRASGLAPQPVAGNRQGIILSWCPGETLDESRFSQQRPQILALLQRLHQQPLTGYRLLLLPLLWRYWQLTPQRNHRWLRSLRRLTQQGEPQPLRLAPLHMDLHAGNVIQSPAGLQLIDWEYAADGDVALELAAICACDPQHQHDWLAGYAAAMQLPLTALAQQVRRWQPWLRLLMASWYQLRADQCDDATLQQLARQSWEQI